jgi:hypothetical protein
VTRNEILNQLEQNRAQLLEVLSGIPEHEMVSRPAVEWWTLKDLLGHIAMWEQVALQFIAEYRQDGLPKSLGLSDDAALDAYNKRGAALRRDWPLERVRAEFDTSHRDLMAAVQSLSDVELNAALPAPWPEGYSLASLIAVNSYDHEREHLEQISRQRLARL